MEKAKSSKLYYFNELFFYFSSEVADFNHTLDGNVLLGTGILIRLGINLTRIAHKIYIYWWARWRVQRGFAIWKCVYPSNCQVWHSYGRCRNSAIISRKQSKITQIWSLFLFENEKEDVRLVKKKKKTIQPSSSANRVLLRNANSFALAFIHWKWLSVITEKDFA